MKITDEVLVREYINGSESAFKEVFKRHHSRLLEILFYKTGDYNSAEDLAQETWFKVCQNLNKFSTSDIPSNFGGWVYTIGKRTWLDKVRSDNRPFRKNVTNVDYIENLGDIEEIEESDNTLLDIMPDLIMQIPFQLQKEVMLLSTYTKLTHREISDKLNIKLNTSLASYRYAIQKLKIICNNKLAA